MAYGGTPATVTRDAVRLLVGDISTSTASEYLTNTDYDFFVAESSNKYISAQLAANSLAALWAGSAASTQGGDWIERKIGDFTIKRSDAAKAQEVALGYRILAQKFGRMAAAGLVPYAGGISVADKDEIESDTDRVKPAFLRKLFDNPQAVDLVGGSSST